MVAIWPTARAHELQLTTAWPRMQALHTRVLRVIVTHQRHPLQCLTTTSPQQRRPVQPLRIRTLRRGLAPGAAPAAAARGTWPQRHRGSG
jgi:hypothetical protein